METVIIIGWAASLASTTSFLPQLIKAWKTKNTKDLSLPMYLILLAAIFLWTIYGLMTHSWPMIITNILVFSMASIILGLKLKYG